MKIVSSFLKSYLKPAAELLKNPAKLNRLLEEASEKASKHQAVLKALREDISWLIKLVSAYIKGEYRKIPWKAIVAIIAALIYFLNPLDLIPDFLAGIGFVDDITVLAYVLKMVRDELDKFKLFLVSDEIFESDGEIVQEIPESLEKP